MVNYLHIKKTRPSPNALWSLHDSATLKVAFLALGYMAAASIVVVWFYLHPMVTNDKNGIFQPHVKNLEIIGQGSYHTILSILKVLNFFYINLNKLQGNQKYLSCNRSNC